MIKPHPYLKNEFSIAVDYRAGRAGAKVKPENKHFSRALPPISKHKSAAYLNTDFNSQQYPTATVYKYVIGSSIMSQCYDTYMAVSMVKRCTNPFQPNRLKIIYRFTEMPNNISPPSLKLLRKYGRRVMRRTTKGHKGLPRNVTNNSHSGNMYLIGHITTVVERGNFNP